jgi:hypothetical protein
LENFQKCSSIRSFLAQKVKISLKNGILGGAFYENFEWGMLFLKPPLNLRAAKIVWRAACGPHFGHACYRQTPFLIVYLIPNG